MSNVIKINTKILKDTKSINLYEIPTGKHKFIATVKDKYIEEPVFNPVSGQNIFVPYIHFKDIKVFLNNIWFDVECSGNVVKSRLGKKLQRLNLEENDIICFNAQVQDVFICFSSIEGEEDDDFDFDFDDDFFDYEFQSTPSAILPKSYQGLIGVDMYETAFTKYMRLWKNNFTVYFDRKDFDKEYKNLDLKIEATDRKDGYFREAQRMYFSSKNIKHFSSIRKIA